jgi:hypothetical protein
MTVVGLNYEFAGQMKVEEITGGATYSATMIAGLDAQRQASENELPAPGTRGAPSQRPPRNVSADRRRTRQALAASIAQSSGTVLAAWKRNRKTRTAWNKRSMTCSPTSGERAARFGFRAWTSRLQLRA